MTESLCFPMARSADNGLVTEKILAILHNLGIIPLTQKSPLPP